MCAQNKSTQLLWPHRLTCNFRLDSEACASLVVVLRASWLASRVKQINKLLFFFLRERHLIRTGNLSECKSCAIYSSDAKQQLERYSPKKRPRFIFLCILREAREFFSALVKFYSVLWKPQFKPQFFVEMQRTLKRTRKNLSFLRKKNQKLIFTSRWLSNEISIRYTRILQIKLFRSGQETTLQTVGDTKCVCVHICGSLSSSKTRCALFNCKHKQPQIRMWYLNCVRGRDLFDR